MNIIGQLDPSAFRSEPRLHHREDELALQFPSGASSRARGLLALRAMNWSASLKGDPMVVTSLITRNGSNNTAILSNWFSGAFDREIPASSVLVRKSNIDDSIKTYALVMMTVGADGAIGTHFFRGFPGSYTVGNSSNQWGWVKAGDEFYVLPADWV